MKSLAGAVLATIQDYPSIAGGSCAFLVAFSLVAGNAMLGQPGGHPDPIWATRDKVTTQSVDRRETPETVPQPAPVPVRKVSVETIAPETVVPETVPVPTKRPALASDPAVSGQAIGQAPDQTPGQVDDHNDLVRHTQQALAGLGLYSGEVDGVYGPHTRDAVLDFQRANGLKADGEISREVFEEAMALMSRPEPEKTPAAEQTAAVQQSDDDQVAQRMGGYNAPRLPRAEPASFSSAPDNGGAMETPEDIARSAMIARIQIGLLNFGEAGISVDGVLGPRTVDAIRAFQQRYGLSVTGEPEEAVIRKMEQIGALHNS